MKPKPMRGAIRLVGLILAACLSLGRAGRAGSEPLPDIVHFAGPGQQDLVGYLFAPPHHDPRVPAIVMLHGRAGPYSSLANGVYDATTLSKRHIFWGNVWAQHGYVALLVDSFGPRGFPQGFPVHSYKDRPEAVNEVTVRPLDAYAALAYLKSRSDVDPDHIALQGWSNGGSTTLATMAVETLHTAGLSAQQGFRGAVAFYPACKLHDAFKAGYASYAPVRVFSGDADEEVSASRCARLVDAARAGGSDIAITVYPGATHDFDDPGKKRQSVAANVTAAGDALTQATDIMRKLLGR